MKPVRAKKKLGQHFLTDLKIAQKIADTLNFKNYTKVLEIGPRDITNTNKSVYLYLDELSNYNETHIGRDAVLLLEGLGYTVSCLF